MPKLASSRPSGRKIFTILRWCSTYSSALVIVNVTSFSNTTAFTSASYFGRVAPAAPRTQSGTAACACELISNNRRPYAQGEIRLPEFGMHRRFRHDRLIVSRFHFVEEVFDLFVHRSGK